VNFPYIPLSEANALYITAEAFQLGGLQQAHFTCWWRYTYEYEEDDLNGSIVAWELILVIAVCGWYAQDEMRQG